MDELEFLFFTLVSSQQKMKEKKREKGERLGGWMSTRYLFHLPFLFLSLPTDRQD